MAEACSAVPGSVIDAAAAEGLGVGERIVSCEPDGEPRTVNVLQRVEVGWWNAALSITSGAGRLSGWFLVLEPAQGLGR